MLFHTLQTKPYHTTLTITYHTIPYHTKHKEETSSHFMHGSTRELHKNNYQEHATPVPLHINRCEFTSFTQHPPLSLCLCFQKEKNRKWLQSARWVPDRLSWLGWSRQVSRLGSRVGKCQIFYTDQYQQTRFYPERKVSKSRHFWHLKPTKQNL